MTRTDQLTGLANRRHLLRTVAALRGTSAPRGAVLVIDLDGFTAVNDLRGPEIGDAVLVEAARRLRAGVDPSDLPARLAADEFAVATQGPPVQTYALASRLLTMLTEPYELPAATVHLTACVGIADWPTRPGRVTRSAGRRWPCAGPGMAGAAASSGTTRRWRPLSCAG